MLGDNVGTPLIASLSPYWYSLYVGNRRRFWAAQKRQREWGENGKQGKAYTV